MAEYDDDEIEGGATLAQALEAIKQDSDDWAQYKALESEISDFEEREKIRAEKQPQSFSQPVIHSHANMPGFPIRNIELGINPQKNKFERLQNGFHLEFLQLLLTGNLVAFGRVGSLSEPYKIIRSEFWPKMEFVSLEQSVICEKSQAQTEWLEVRIFAKSEEPKPINAALHDADNPAPLNSKIRTASLSSKMSIDACIMDYYANNKSDFDKVKTGKNTQIWLAELIAKKYNRSVDSVSRSLRDPLKSPLHTEY